MKYLLDTNICIYIIRQKPDNVIKKFLSLSTGSIGLSVITLAELQYGISKSSQPDKNALALEKFLIPLQIIEFNAAASVEYGKIRSNLEKTGNVIGSMDMLIAAHAKSLNLTLVTNNEKEFRRVSGLEVENWVNE